MEDDPTLPRFGTDCFTTHDSLVTIHCLGGFALSFALTRLP